MTFICRSNADASNKRWSSGGSVTAYTDTQILPLRHVAGSNATSVQSRAHLASALTTEPCPPLRFADVRRTVHPQQRRLRLAHPLKNSSLTFVHPARLTRTPLQAAPPTAGTRLKTFRRARGRECTFSARSDGRATIDKGRVVPLDCLPRRWRRRRRPVPRRFMALQAHHHRPQPNTHHRPPSTPQPARGASTTGGKRAQRTVTPSLAGLPPPWAAGT